MYVHMHMYDYVYTYLYVRACIYTHTYIYIYIYMYNRWTRPARAPKRISPSICAFQEPMCCGLICVYLVQLAFPVSTDILFEACRVL